MNRTTPERRKQAPLRFGGAARRHPPSKPWSKGSPLSILSLWSLGGIASVGSILSIGSAGSILSIGSAGSILSIGGAGSVSGQDDED